MTGLTQSWTLDPRLAADTIPICANEGWQTRLMNDRRWPWLIVVPALPGLADIDDCPPDFHAELMAHLRSLSAALKQMGACRSTNVATLGNVVTQMHWHVVGRNEGDANWPGPVWGFEKAVAYAKDEADAFISSLRATGMLSS